MFKGVHTSFNVHEQMQQAANKLMCTVYQFHYLQQNVICEDQKKKDEVSIKFCSRRRVVFLDIGWYVLFL